jgi:SSS family solute:Na+ symporter
MTALDYAVLIAYFVVSIGLGLYLVRWTGEMKSLSHFFLSGRNMPWWLLGTSMVATTFAADTPIFVSAIAAQFGLYFNWIFMPFLFTATLTTFFFARLWRRSEVMTDVEFLELRYPGGTGRFLRGFKALYLGIIVNSLIIGTQLIAIGKIAETVMGIDKDTAMLLGAAVSLFYAVYAGFAGVVITDFFQFIVAMVGSILLAVFVLMAPEVGGLAGLVEKLGSGVAQQTPAGAVDLPILRMMPGADTPYLTIWLMLIPVFVTWWSVVYGGTEPGGGGQVVQRMLAAKSEAHAAGASLWFNVAHFALRAWPWLLVGLAGVILYPGTQDWQRVYGLAIHDLLPSGLRGLMVASFFAAFISTMETRLNLGAAYLVNDFYHRFLARDRSDAHYVAVSRVATVLMTALPFAIPYLFQDSIIRVIMFWMEITAGTGLVFILRWYWWRVNAWSEISAMVAAIVYTIGLIVVRYGGSMKAYAAVSPAEDLVNILIVTILTTITWVVVTFLTPPTDREGLRRFYRKTRPAGPGWNAVAADLRAEGLTSPDSMGASLVGWISASVLLLTVFFGTGKLLLLDFVWGSILMVIALASLAVLLTVIRRVFA